MRLTCKECGGVFERYNGTDRKYDKYLCDNCFIDFLEGFIKKTEAMSGFDKYMPFLKKLLDKKLIQRLEGKSNGREIPKNQQGNGNDF